MKIHRDNYEAYMLDYIEGRLGAKEEAALMDFLERHPELKSELDEYSNEPLSPPASDSAAGAVGLSAKERMALHKSRESQLERLFVFGMEGSLNAAEQKELERYLLDPGHREAFEQWTLCRLQAAQGDGVRAFDSSDLYRFRLDEAPDEDNFEYHCIAFAEGLLSAPQEQALWSFAEKQPGAKAVLLTYTNLRLQAASGIFYSDKAALRKDKKGGFIPWALRIAAVLALIFALSAALVLLLREPGAEGESALAEQKTADRVEPSSDQSEEDIATALDSLPGAEGPGEIQPKSATPATELHPAKPEVDPRKVDEQNELLAGHSDEAAGSGSLTDASREARAGEDEMKNTWQAIPEAPRWTAITRSTTEPALALHRLEPAMLDEPSSPQESPEYDWIQELPRAPGPGQFALQELAARMDVHEQDPDKMPLALARRIARQAGEVLDVDYSKRSDHWRGSTEYVFRIGSFKLQRSTQR